mgnify:FL=1
MLLERRRKIAGLLEDLYACHDRKLKRVQKRDSLTTSAWIQAHHNGSRFGQPVRRLNNRYARLFDELENLESLERVCFFSTIRKNPLHNDAGVKHYRCHGLPCLLAARTALSVTCLLCFRNTNNFSTTLARR